MLGWLLCSRAERWGALEWGHIVSLYRAQGTFQAVREALARLSWGQGRRGRTVRAACGHGLGTYGHSLEYTWSQAGGHAQRVQ